MRRTPAKRDIQALDLRNYNVGEETQTRQREQYSPRDTQRSATPRATGYSRNMQQANSRAQAVSFGKGNSSSEQSLTQAISRSWSMINLPAPRANPIRLRAGYGHLSGEDEEMKRFYHSVDPSVEYDDLELELEPLRVTRRQMARLRAGSPNNCPPPQEQNNCPDNYSRPPDPCSRPQNFSSFCPPGASGGPGRSGTQSPTRRSSYDQYSSIPARPPSMSCPPMPPMSPWSPPIMQSSPMSRQFTRPPSRYSQDTSSVLYESPRQSQFAQQAPRYKSLQGHSFKMPGLTSPGMATQWITPPGNMPSAAYSAQSSICQPSSQRQSRWEPPPCPQNMDVPLTCPPKNEDPCQKERLPLPCEGCEEKEEGEGEEKSYDAPPRCRPLDPEILRKLCCDLPPFKIPRCMEDEFICMKRREQWETLVKDQNCPGAIQSTIDGMVNFNELVYDIVFGETRLPECLPRIDPITLLEAFLMRVNYERCQIKKLEQLTYAKENPDDDDDRKPPPPSDDCTIIEKCFKRKYPTEINKAIELLLKAEKGFDYQNPDPEQPAMNLVLDKTSTDLPGIPITVKAYTGTTKPRE